MLARLDDEKADWERQRFEKRDELEREMLLHYPDDYEVYLLQTNRPPVEGFHWVDHADMKLPNNNV